MSTWTSKSLTRICGTFANERRVVREKFGKLWTLVSLGSNDSRTGDCCSLIPVGLWQVICRLIPKFTRVIQAAHFGEQQRFQFLELLGITRVAGEVPLPLLGGVASQGDSSRSARQTSARRFSGQMAIGRRR